MVNVVGATAHRGIEEAVYMLVYSEFIAVDYLQIHSFMIPAGILW